MERIDYSEAVFAFIKTRLIVSVVFRGQFIVKFLRTFNRDQHFAAGAAIAVVLGEMQDQFAARNLHVEREIVTKAMLPIDLKTEPIDIKFPRLFIVKDAKNRHRSLNLHLYKTPSRGQVQ